METTRDLLDRRASVHAISTPEPERARLMRRNATESSLRHMLPGLGLDELRILERQAEKMLRHKREYGEFIAATDSRNLRAEAADEHSDAIFYILAEEIKRSDERVERLRCEAADEMAAVERGLTELRDAEIETAPTPRLSIDERFDDDYQFDDADVGGEGDV